MLDAVFISDLHLHPEEPLILSRFNQLLDWAIQNTSKLYILGDFFHVWAGDDGVDAWSLGIAEKLLNASKQGLQLFYMHGNRDFLLGKKFAALCGMTIIPDPFIITLGHEKILLSHGDYFCSLDKSHQRFRKLTRNSLFIKTFLNVPYVWRQRLVQHVRNKSKHNRVKDYSTMNVVTETLFKVLRQAGVKKVIHGHIHKPGLTRHASSGLNYEQYVLSDWDDRPVILCYDRPKGLEFEQPVL